MSNLNIHRPDTTTSTNTFMILGGENHEAIWSLKQIFNAKKYFSTTFCCVGGPDVFILADRLPLGNQNFTTNSIPTEAEIKSECFVMDYITHGLCTKESDIQIIDKLYNLKKANIDIYIISTNLNVIPHKIRNMATEIKPM